MFNDFFKKKKSILTPEDIRRLQELKRASYMEEAEKLIIEQGKLAAREEIQIKPKQDYYSS